MRTEMNLTGKLKENWDIWFLYFLVFSLIGWLYELGVFAIELNEGIVNRGFLFGPYLPIYGFGGLLIIAALGPIKTKRVQVLGVSITPVLCFVCMVFIATAVELLGSYLMEWTTGGWLWDYTDYGPNFQGRISVRSSIRFGVMGMVGLYGLHPLLQKSIKLVRNTKEYRYCVLFIAAVFLLDVAARFFLGSNY